VSLQVPNVKSKYPLESVAPEFVVSELYYCSLLKVLKSTCLSPDTQKYHWIPHRLFHKSQETDIHVYTDIYNSDAMLEEDAKLQVHLHDSGEDCNIKVTTLTILLWSDSTHLMNFGMALLWPIYLFLGNILKYTRSKLSTHTAHHLAYVLSVRVGPCSALAAYSHMHLASGYNSRLLCEKTWYHSHYNCLTVP
jgi:hypothetical protein